MRGSDKPTFSIVVPTASAAERRLVTAAAVRAMIASPEGDDATLNTIIDGVSADCARYCKLARAGTAPATFGREAVRATWLVSGHHHFLHGRGTEISLPWRLPIAEVAVTEGGVDLEDDAFRLLDGCILQRLSGGAPTCWSSAAIEVDLIVGWVLDPEEASASEPDADPIPADLANAVIAQVNMRYLGRKRAADLRSRATDEVGSETFNVPGGDSLEADGLLGPLKAALAPFRRMVIA